ncbi:MAG: hypothetical protein IPM51_00770 [Sphingobacteriaceae bacterium]|nr:hypothetical protein [Sphingobacteriaceae bacterium]
MKNLLFILLFLDSFNINSQPLTFEENYRAHKRYWFYRARVINDFMKIDNEQGNCIMLAERNYEYTGQEQKDQYNKYYSKVGPDQIDLTNMYLANLALEYKLLSRANQSTQETIKEIYYILKTLNRLDNEADQFWEQNKLS